MKSPARLLAMTASIALLISICGFAPNAAQNAASKTGTEIKTDIIVTAAPAYEPLAALRGGERFPKGAQLLLVHEGKAESLVKGFAATADANVFFDGTRVLFAGKKTASDPWQIWELTLADHSVRKLTASTSDAIRPFYLPAGRMVYAQRTAHGFELESAGKDSSYALQKIDADAASEALPLSHLPGNAIPADVLLDGRILFEANYPLGTGATPEMFLVYSDGSGVESYRCDHGRARWGGKQLASGDVVFTHGASLARFTSPLAHEAFVAAPKAEYAGAIAETAAGAWLASTRTAPSARYALKLWKPGTTAMKTVLAESDENLVEPVLLSARTRPNHHPSALHPWDYANVMALDARLAREGTLKEAPTAVRLETQDAAGHAVVTGTAPIEKDGSFFVQVPGDKPIRFALLNEKGAVMRQEHGWIWIRSGEQRICVGCHTGPERSSENRVPAVLLRTTMPADLTGKAGKDSTQQKSPGGN